MSGIRISRDLQSSTPLESLSSSSPTEQLEQNTGSPHEVRTQEKYDPRTSGATKEAAASKLAEQKLAGQAQEARLRALLAGGLPKLPLIDAGAGTKGFGSAPAGTMPIDRITTPDEVNYSKLASMDLRELNALATQLSEQISETRTKIAELDDYLTTLNIIASHPFASSETKEAIKKVEAEIAAEVKKLRILERQHHVVLQEIESQKFNERQ